MGDFAALERDLLAALKHDGARWVEALLNDPALPVKNHQPQADEENYGLRPKAVLISLGWITLRRSYLYSATRKKGRFPLDDALGLVESSSPAVVRWACHAVALAGSYQAASQDLLIYAGWEIDARQIQRLVTHMAPGMTRWREAQGPVFSPTAGDIFCLGADGTGAPMRPKELRGRKGKNGGRARTREVKVGTIFTHRQPDQPDQRPERDYASGYFIGSGVVEAGCKTVGGQRLKQSGMLWTRTGASHLLTLRCALLSGWFDDFWKHHSRAAQGLAFAA